MNDALAKAGSESQIHVYEDAPYAFHPDCRPTYRKAPAQEGCNRLMAWQQQNGV